MFDAKFLGETKLTLITQSILLHTLNAQLMQNAIKNTTTSITHLDKHTNTHDEIRTHIIMSPQKKFFSLI